MRVFSDFLQDDSGATVIEYAIIISATAMALIFTMPSIRSKLEQILVNVVTSWL